MNTTAEETPMQQLKRKLQESIAKIDPLDDMSEISYSVALKNVVKDIDAQMLSIEKAYSESLAKERSVEFYISQEFTDGMYVVANPDHFPNVVKEAGELYDTFLAEKRKEGAE